MVTIEVKFEGTLHLAMAILVVIAFVVFVVVRINISPQTSLLSFLPMLLLLFVFLYKILYVVFSRRAVFGPDSIIFISVFGDFEIKTERIEYIIQGAGNIRIGDSEQVLSVPDIAYWNFGASKEFTNSYLEQLSKRGIVPVDTLKAFWPTCRNCRIG